MYVHKPPFSSACDLLEGFIIPNTKNICFGLRITVEICIGLMHTNVILRRPLSSVHFYEHLLMSNVKQL